MPPSTWNAKTIILKISVGNRSFGKRRCKIRADRERVERSSTWYPRVRFPPFRFRRMNETSIIVFVVRLPIRNFRNAAQPRSKGGLRLKKYYVTRIFARHPPYSQLAQIVIPYMQRRVVRWPKFWQRSSSTPITF